MTGKRLAIIGAGPIGIEAALRGVEHGWAVTVLEKDQVGSHLLKWGHVRFFSPLKDNVSTFLLKSLPTPPDLSRYLSGKEFVEKILRPLATSNILEGKIREGTQVKAISRRRLIKTEMPSHPIRASRPFNLLVHSRHTGEEIIEADVVLDAGGVYSNANWAGESGLPCPGEREASIQIDRHLPDIPGNDQAAWIDKEILLIGDGHSAATAFVWLSETAKKNPKTRVHWVVNNDRARPCVEVGEDPLPERKQIVETCNNLAQNPPPGWEVIRKSALLKIHPVGAGHWDVLVGRGESVKSLRVQKILSLTGYRPDPSYLEELQTQISPVTGGAGGLAKSLFSITDCLSPVHVPLESLQSGEPGFFMVGHKSYGRLNTFLLRSGLQQLDQIFDLLRRRD